MADSYSTTQYLLDRANIHDTVCKLTLYYDTNNTPGLASDVFAGKAKVDYSILTGAPAVVLDGETWAATIGKVLAKYDSTQHVVSNIVADLGQPGARQRPDTVSVYAHANGHMVKHAARGGPLMQNGAIFYLELARDPELEKQGANPWRITHHQIFATGWENGNSAVHEEAFAVMKGH
ncbi:hypothetical protein CONLIGDRAFT_717788 [Coniochaeta ligniaria NRRL 30616]|uniref:SnoaL-like domain-containing protein n=1 Tax=Coniochaeta ligniaria NRRL 30616 TaxID=1408157 RepID=A0A1J7IFC9_9PEZI|nr:hypothetical protein CONLIGDRAFT_717788 [Coniochaeta ligniaria NRRL 30616]